MKEVKNLNSRLLRWSLTQPEFDFKIEHVKGENNIGEYLSGETTEGISKIKRVGTQYTEQEKNKILE